MPVFVRLRQRSARSSSRWHVTTPRLFTAAAVDFTNVCDSREPGSHVLGPVLAEALVALGRFDEAASALDDFEVMARAYGPAFGAGRRRRGRSGQLAAARGDWDRADYFSRRRWLRPKSWPCPWRLVSPTWHGAHAAVRDGQAQMAARELQTAGKVSRRAEPRAFASIGRPVAGEHGL